MFWFWDRGLSEEALGMVASEDISQREEWGNQCHSIYKWQTIAMEEVGELSKAMLEADLGAIEKEATQAATLLLKIAWMARERQRKLND